MLALWGRLWSRLGFRFWNGFGLPIPRDKTVINNIFGEIKLAMLRKPTSQLVHVKVDRMYVTAKPGVPTLVMAENHIKTNSSGLQ